MWHVSFIIQMKTDWPTKKLGEVIKFLPKSLRRAGDGLNNGKFPFFTSSPIQKKFLNVADYKEEAIILGTGGSASLHICKNFSTSADVFIIKSLNTNRLENKYLYLFLVANISILNEGFKGAALKHLSKEYLKNIEIPLPSIEVQKKIVAKLEKVLAKISEAKKLRIEARESADNLLSTELHKIFEEGKKKSWEEKELGEIANEINSGFACGKQNEVVNGVVHLRTHNINTEGNLNFDKITQIPKKLVVQNAFGLERGDILFNNTNSTELVGKTALVTEELPYAFSNHLTHIKVNKNKVFPEWIVYIFNTFWKDKYFESICTRWVGQSGVNQTALKKIKILLPSLAEQKKIVARLDKLSQKIEKIKKLQAATQNEFTILEQSILSKAFKGKLKFK